MRASWLNATGLKKTGLFFGVALFLLAGSPGIRPRASVADYPAHQAASSFTVGAAVIPPGDVKKIFAADLNAGGYIVIEAGVFPLPGKDVDLSPGDFMLLTDAGRVATRPVDAGDIAAVIGRGHRASPSSAPSGVYTTTGVAVSHGSAVDPATGRRISGTVVEVDAGVGGGTPPVNYPVSQAGPNLAALEQELWAKSLPDGRTAVAVAGYLYFPKSSGKTNGAWELTMDGAAGRVKLTLQNPGKR
jgi:hypothetical protein